MAREEVLGEVLALLERLSEFSKVGPGSSWELEWKKLSNDVEEFAERTFSIGSKDWEAIHGALHPSMVSVGTNEWEDVLRNYQQPVTEALALVQHRLEQGQARLRETAPTEHVVEPGTPHSAYVLLRDIIEGASTRIVLVDPYVDRSLFPVLSNAKPSVDIQILTRQHNVPRDFAEELRRFAEQEGMAIEARCGLEDFHDRLLVADGRLFLSGASFKDLGKKGSFVIEFEDIRDEALGRLEQRWSSATPL